MQEKTEYIRALNTASQWLAYGNNSNTHATHAALCVNIQNAAVNRALQDYRSAVSKEQTAVAYEAEGMIMSLCASILDAYNQWGEMWHSATPSENAGQF